MKEIVKDILKEEEEARSKIKKATVQAEEIINNAREEAENFARKVNLDAKEAIKKRQEETEKELFSMKENVIRETGQEAVTKIEHKKGDISRLAREVFQEIINF